MFDYPLLLPSDTEYDKLKIEPTATREEIQDALAQYRRSIERQQREFADRITSVLQLVPGLGEALHRRDHSDDQTACTCASAQITELEQQALAYEPEYYWLRQRIQELQIQIEKANLSPLRNPESQLDYDRSVAPLALLKIDDCLHAGLSDNRTVLIMLRRELSSFLAMQGEQVFHPSDITRTDFSLDFEYLEALDGGEM